MDFIGRIEPPRRPDGHLDWVALHTLWMASPEPVLRRFGERFDIPASLFIRRTKGWATQRIVALHGSAAARGRPGSLTERMTAQTRQSLLIHWTSLLDRLASVPLDSPAAGETFKHLSAQAAVLRAAHQGLGELLPLGADPDESAPLRIEGCDVARI